MAALFACSARRCIYAQVERQCGGSEDLITPVYLHNNLDVILRYNGERRDIPSLTTAMAVASNLKNWVDAWRLTWAWATLADGQSLHHPVQWHLPFPEMAGVVGSRARTMTDWPAEIRIHLNPVQLKDTL